MTDHIIVNVCEEYGYRYWRWEPQMTGAELVNFWKSLQTIPFFDPTVLPGVWIEFDPDSTEFDAELKPGFAYAHIHSEDDSYLELFEVGIVHHSGYGRNDCQMSEE